MLSSLVVYDPGQNSSWGGRRAGGVYIISIFASSRYRNGRRLPELTVGMRSSLFIANVNVARGLYTCKAIND